MSLTTLIKRHVELSVLAAAALVLTLFASFFVSPRSLSTKNEAVVTRLMAKALPERSLADPSRIERVTLADHVTLVPEHEKIVAGYILKLNVQSSTFTLEARPLEIGRTGIFSFFRDNAGVVRFAPDVGKPAGVGSPRWFQSPPE